jgi:hypothetical protein
VEAAFERGAGFMDTALPGQCCHLPACSYRWHLQD